MSDFFIFSWDIMNTIYIDTEIENERDEAMTSATLLLMRNMHGNGDVNKDVMDKATQKFKRYVKVYLLDATRFTFFTEAMSSIGNRSQFCSDFSTLVFKGDNLFNGRAGLKNWAKFTRGIL